MLPPLQTHNQAKKANETRASAFRYELNSQPVHTLSYSKAASTKASLVVRPLLWRGDGLWRLRRLSWLRRFCSAFRPCGWIVCRPSRDWACWVCKFFWSRFQMQGGGGRGGVWRAQVWFCWTCKLLNAAFGGVFEIKGSHNYSNHQKNHKQGKRKFWPYSFDVVKWSWFYWWNECFYFQAVHFESWTFLCEADAQNGVH